MAQYSIDMIFAVLDVSRIMGLNSGETDSFFTLMLTIYICNNDTSRCRARKRGRGRILGSFCSTSHRLAQACPIS